MIGRSEAEPARNGGRFVFKLDLQPVGFLRVLRVGSPGAEKNHLNTLLADGAINLSTCTCICDKLRFTV